MNVIFHTIDITIFPPGEKSEKRLTPGVNACPQIRGAVRIAAENGELPDFRYQAWLRLLNEQVRLSR